MSSGSSASGTTQYNWNEDMAPRWNSLLNTAPWAAGFQFNSDGNVVGINDRERYRGQRVANLSPDQVQAGDYFRGMNAQSSNPVGAMNAARSQIESTLAGNYLGPNSNPWAGTTGANPYLGGNQYMGESPAFNAMLGQTLDDITGAYQRGTAADTTRMFNMSGAFGGSAHQNAVSNNEANLGRTLSQTANQMRSDQFNRSAGMRENEINRGFQNYTNMANQGFNAFENERGRMMGAIGAGQAENGLAIDRGNAMLNYGGLAQQNTQQGLDFLYDQWSQEQNHPFQMMQFLSDLYGRAMGGGGMNQTVYGGGNSDLGQIAGGLLGAYALTR